MMAFPVKFKTVVFLAVFAAAASPFVPAQTGMAQSQLLAARQNGTPVVQAAKADTGNLGDSSGSGISQQAVLAMSTESYPATPGDVYELGFFRATQTERVRLVVEGDGSINAGFFGRLDTKGQTFRQIKATVEKKVAEAYPGSNPQLLITMLGTFPVKCPEIRRTCRKRW